MLKLFRRKKIAVKVMLFAIVFIVGGGMLLYLVPGVGGGSLALTDPQGVLAQVGGSVITQVELNRLVQLQLRQMGGDNEFFRQILLENTLEQLINQRVIEYEASQLGLQATSVELATRLQEISLFYPEGRFVGAEAYRRLVQQQFNRSVPEFEQELRRQILAQKVLTWVSGGVTVSPSEIEQEFRRRNDQVRLEYVVFKPSNYERRVRPGEDDLRAYHELNRDRYQLPERRSVRYVPVDFFTLRQRVSISQAELEAAYRSRRDEFQVPERVRARHILFLVDLPDQRAAVREQAEKVLGRLRQGADFASLARQQSQDENTREAGGEMWVQRGQAVSALETKFFSLAPGSAPELVETDYGFHVMQVLAHEQERLRPLAEVRGQIEPGLRQRKVQEQALTEARQLVQAVRSGQTLQQAAEAGNWMVLESPLFSREQVLPEFGEDFEFQSAAFRLPAGSAGQPDSPVSEPVGLSTGFVVMRLKEVSPSHTAEFEEVRGQVVNSLRRDRGAEMAREAAQELAQQAGKAGTLAPAARRAGLQVETSPLIGRQGSLPDIGLISAIATSAFGLPVGGISEAQQAGGNWVVFRVLDRQEADPDKLEGERDSLRAALLDQKRGLQFQIFQQAVRKKRLADGVLTLNAAAINRILNRR